MRLDVRIESWVEKKRGNHLSCSRTGLYGALVAALSCFPFLWPSLFVIFHGFDLHRVPSLICRALEVQLELLTCTLYSPALPESFWPWAVWSFDNVWATEGFRNTSHWIRPLRAYPLHLIPPKRTENFISGQGHFLHFLPLNPFFWALLAPQKSLFFANSQCTGRVPGHPPLTGRKFHWRTGGYPPPLP